ncbi:MAG: hypothetical protein Q8O85_02130 [Rhodoferax sp.]|uniref:hypothetical protein n=1 Tax=Rhodoferax sp. TaxID=50421 RepID=UPI002736CF74|nr:hypothetical protein [Rhodoferax sp.]MDP2677508.1 hypothetical protein [Rhodoferax sp.]
MRLRKLLFVVAVAFLTAAAIGYWFVAMSYPEKLIRLQVAQRLGQIDQRLAVRDQVDRTVAPVARFLTGGLRKTVFLLKLRN